MGWLGTYLAELWNSWLWVAGGMLTAFELISFFTKKTWGWPGRHPWTVAGILLLIAQAGAYYSTTTGATAEMSTLSVTIDALTNERDQLRVDKAKLEGTLEERERQAERQREVENELRDKLADARDARPISIESVNVPSTATPQIEGITITTRQVPSSRNEDAPYAIEVTVQAASRIESFGIGFVCDKEIVGGQLIEIVGGSLMTEMRGSGQLNIERPERSWGVSTGNAISPSMPWIVTLFGKEPFSIIRYERIRTR